MALRRSLFQEQVVVSFIGIKPVKWSCEIACNRDSLGLQNHCNHVMLASRLSRTHGFLHLLGSDRAALLYLAD
jgi:hypothetical protein